MKKFSTTRRRTGNEASVFVGCWVRPTSSPQNTADNSSIQTFIITGETKSHRDTGREQKVPIKQHPDVAFIFYLFFFTLYFISSIIQSTSLIDMTTSCVILVPDI